MVGNSSNETLSDNYNQEKTYMWRGMIGLISITDYTKANSNSELCDSVNKLNSNGATCLETNWINYLDYSQAWTINASPIEYGSHYVWFIGGGSSDKLGVTKNQAYNSKSVFPVFYLSSSLLFKGTGSFDKPYEIIR